MTYKFFKTQKQRIRKSGFTLIETLIAVTILASAIVGPLAIASRGLSIALVAKDQVTAFYLAQDALEYVRFIRDTNKLQGQAWLAGLDGTSNGHTNGSGGVPGGICTGGSSCLIDSIQDATTTCDPAGCAVLNYDSTSNFFTYTSTGGSVTKSLFTRTVTITYPVTGNADEALVSVVVGWKDVGGVARSFSVKENIYNWQ